MRAVSLFFVAALGSLFACKRAAISDRLFAATEMSSSPTASSSAPTMRVEIDPALIARGRVRVGLATVRASADGALFIGEVRADGAGHAEAGVLTSGRIGAIKVDVGESVKKGQVLAWVDSAEAGRAAADLLRANARADIASRKLARQRLLASQDATNANAVDDALLEDKTAGADLQAARVTLASIGASLAPADAWGRLAVRSPIDGVVATRHAVLGGYASPERALFEIRAAGIASILVLVPETATMPTGAQATVIPRANPSQRCLANRIGELGTVEPVSRTRSLRLAPGASCKGLTPGAFVTLAFAEDQAASSPAKSSRESARVVVPSDAIVDLRGTDTVFVATDRPGVFLGRAVSVSHRGILDAKIERGLTDGERVAIEGAELLRSELLRTELSP